MIFELEVSGLKITPGQNARELMLGRGRSSRAMFGAQASRKNHEREKLVMAWIVNRWHRTKFELPVVITLTRVAPGRLDDDNLGGGFKNIRDEIARLLGVDDGDTEKIGWVYRQERAKTYGMKVKITTKARAMTVVSEETGT